MLCKVHMYKHKLRNFTCINMNTNVLGGLKNGIKVSYQKIKEKK